MYFFFFCVSPPQQQKGKTARLVPEKQEAATGNRETVAREILLGPEFNY